MSNVQYVVPDEDFDLYEFACTLWGQRWLVLLITVVFTIGGTAYAFLATEWFKSEVVMVPTDDNNSLSGNLAQLGGLASLAGINIGSGGQAQAHIAVLKSKELVRDFIADRKLTKVLLVDQLDTATGEWKAHDPAKQPDVRDAVAYFQKKVCAIVEDKKAGLVTLSITWKNSQVSADWANDLAQRANAKLRDQATAEAERNIKYLKDEMAVANVTSLQQSIGRVLESEMQKLLLSRGNDEFAFKVVDRAVGPRKPTWPLRPIIIVASALLGLLTSIVVILARREIQGRRASSATSDEQLERNASAAQLRR